MKVRCQTSNLTGMEKCLIQDVHEKTGLSRSAVSGIC